MKNTQKNYNIFFILNSPYFTFGKILIKSIYKNCNTEDIRKIYILDTGLSEVEKKYLKSFDKVELLDSGLYLGSYVGILNTNGLLFIDDCITDMENSANRYLEGKIWPKESKAMSRVAMSYKKLNKLNIKDFSLSEVSEFSSDNIGNCHIVHFKGSTLSSTTEELIQSRIYNRGFGPYVSEYLDE